MDLPGPTTSPKPTLTILVADDDRAIRALLADALRRDNATVITARDGAEALALARRCEGSIDLLLTDFEMPYLDGVQLAAEVRALYPGVPVIMMSGSPGSAAWPEPATFLKKPFSMTALMEKVAAVLPKP